MGHNPIPLAFAVIESIYAPSQVQKLDMARNAYVDGRIDLQRFEWAIETVFAGGVLPHDITGSQFPRPIMQEIRA